MTCKHWCFTVSDLKMNLCGIIYTTQYRFFLFFLNVTNFHFSTDQLQFNQMSLIPPLPSILVNQSTQEMIMTHCLSSKIAPDTSDITCLSVYDYTALTFFYWFICICTSIRVTCAAKMSISSYVQAFSSGHLVFVLSNFIFSCRFVCCVMVAIPLGATLLTAMIRWQWKRKVEPTLESSCLNAALNLYGTLKTSSSSSSETNSWSSEESSKCKVHHLDLLRSSTAYHTYYGYYLQ